MRKELLSLRQENSKTFDLGGGRRRLEVRIGAIHYKDNYADLAERWKDIDPTFVDGKITKAPYELTVDGKKATIRDKKSGRVSTIELLESSPAGLEWKVVPDNDKISFRHIFSPDKIPFEAKFRVTGKFPFVTRAYDDEGELEHFQDIIAEEDELTEDGEILVAKGDVIGQKLIPNLEVTFKDGILTEKLSSLSRPAKGQIRIDPTLTVQPPGKDTWLRENAPTSPQGSATYVQVQTSTTSNRARPLIGFNLSGQLPAGASIISSALSLYYYQWGDADPVGCTYWCYRLTRNDWTEAGATWQQYKSGSAWTTAGGDWTTVDPAGSSTTMPSSFGWVNWDAKTLAEDAIANRGNLLDLLIKDANDYISTQYLSRFYSKEYTTDPTLQPKLVIEYTVPTPVAEGDLIGIAIIRKS